MLCVIVYYAVKGSFDFKSRWKLVSIVFVWRASKMYREVLTLSIREKP